jgi:hypothetical protein
MSGTYMKLAIDSLKLFLHCLPIGCKFNVVSFGSKHTKLFSNSVDYREETLVLALSLIEGFKANMGGTEILMPLKDIFD